MKTRWGLLYMVVICACLLPCNGAKHTDFTKSHHLKTYVNRRHFTPLTYLNHTITKKSNIEDASELLDKMAHEPKNKRGFLANLASLLTDAELIANKKKNSGLSSVTHVRQHISLPSKKDKLKKVSNKNDTLKEDISLKNVSTPSNEVSKNSTVNVATVTKETNKTNKDEVSKKEEVPDIDDINQAFRNSAKSKDFAPIFAMFHGKIVPLGKLADTSFKKTHVVEGHDDDNYVEENPKVHDVTGSKRSFNDETKKAEDEKINDENIENESSKLSKLQKYLTNLDGHVPATTDENNKKAIAKDDVVFPEEEQATPRSDLMSHVKGVVLDSGKIISVNNNHVDLPVEEASKETPPPSENSDDKQKFYVSDDGTLNPLKNKGDMADAVGRDMKETGDGQKTVAISLDVLKDLLKKTDTKVSLAALLNKPAEQRSESTSSEDDDPGTIEDFAAGGLKSHNQYRSKHHSSALVWSDDLAAKAQKLAESLADKKTLEIAKDLEKEGYGENVAKVWATFKNAGEAATKMWYSQSDNYHFDDPHLDENTGQFAQVVWKDTKEIGMGVAKSIDDVNNKYVYVTALYRPPGNIEAKLRDNVLPTGNNTVDVYTTFFKRTGVTTDKDLTGNVKKSHVQAIPLHTPLKSRKPAN